jgi:hypothetical protein
MLLRSIEGEKGWLDQLHPQLSPHRMRGARQRPQSHRLVVRVEQPVELRAARPHAAGEHLFSDWLAENREAIECGGSGDVRPLDRISYECLKGAHPEEEALKASDLVSISVFSASI